MAGNPFRSEAEAYRFLLLTVGYVALIVVAAAIATWLGLVVFVLLTAAVVVLWVRSRSNEPALRPAVPTHESAEDERHILVIANETVGGDELLAILRDKSAGVNEQVLVVCPALNSPVRTWASDEDGARVGGAGAAGREPRAAAPGRRPGAGRDRRRRPAAGDRGRTPHLRRRRDRDLDAPRGPLQLARAERRRRRARALRRPDHARGRRPRSRRDRALARVPLAARAGDDVVGDGLDLLRRVLVLEGRHRALPVRDALDHELLRRLRVVEVGADVAARARRVERVAAAAAGLGEDRLAVRCAASRRRRRWWCRRPPRRRRGRAARPPRRRRTRPRRRPRPRAGRRASRASPCSAPRSDSRSGRGRPTGSSPRRARRSRDCLKASSRFGPITPFEPASASVWQDAHCPSPTNSSLPRMLSPAAASARRSRNPSRRGPRSEPRRRRRARAVSPRWWTPWWPTRRRSPPRGSDGS